MPEIEVYENIIFDAVEKVTGIREITSETNLLSRTVGIFPADFLYIFAIIEKELNVEISSVFIDSTYEVFIVKILQKNLVRYVRGMLILVICNMFTMYYLLLSVSL